MTNLIGQSLGRYHILEQLGEGGMATVYKAFDTRLEREVAVKIIRHGAFPKEQLERMLKRFEREARMLASLAHPNIVRVLDSGEQDGMPYLVMEFIPSGTLKELLGQKPGQPIPWQAAARLLAPIARALHYAHQHEAKIVHRDVKPSNILITKNGTPMLSDFGIAKVLENEETLELTGTGAGIGTPEYMAPEQGINKAVDHRADIYALGTIFYEMVAGRKPYQADTPLAVMMMKSIEPLPRPTKFIADLPEIIERILFKALAKNPEDRYADMGGFADALDRLAEGRLPKSSTLSTATMPFDQTQGKPAPVSSTRSKLAIGFAAAALLVCMLGIAAAWTVIRKLNEPVVEKEAQIPTAEILVAASPVIDLTTFTPTEIPFIIPIPVDIMISPKDGVELVYVPEGEFIMGSDSDEPYWWGAESPKHRVFLDAFWIYRAEVTNALYRACVEAKACPKPTDTASRTITDYFLNTKYDDYPVIYVTYESALSYCVWADAYLPTEAQWEKTARGTDGRLFPWGDDAVQSDYANFCDSNCPNPVSEEVIWDLNDGYRDTSPVGNYPRGTSPFGAWDMAGNVTEWVADWYSVSYYSVSPYENPVGPLNGSKHPIRGGSWWTGAGALRPAARASKSLDYSMDMVGFRCAMPAP